MFRKIVSNLPFSPALVGQLGFYAKRLRKEEATRRLSLVFVVLALIVQSLLVFQPSESANASNASDMISGGLGLYTNQSLNNFLSPYDSNAKHLQDFMNHIGVTRDEISSMQFTSWKVGDKLLWGFTPLFSYAQGERQHNISNPNGQQVTTVYSRPLRLSNNSTSKTWGWVGNSKKLGWFAIMQSSGNLITDAIDLTSIRKCNKSTSLSIDNESCASCPDNETLWANDSSCAPNVIKTVSAINASQGFIDAASVTAQSSDQISYTIDIENTGPDSISVKLENHIADLLEYATLTDNGGGTLDETTKILSWPDITLNSDTKQTRTFVIRILDTIPATAQGASNATSYNCVITNTFGNSIDVHVSCPAPKIIEQVATELPKIGPLANIIFAVTILFITSYFYARTYQMKKEIRLIRRDTNAGTI
ncbi:MAG TPA: hypothetical protein VFD55_02470 [Candidatus Angelobacter sp.]|nr:hypothetical protein [Candidatus Angelobacter sp.]